MLAIYIDLGERFAQPISISLAKRVGQRGRLRSVDPVQHSQPRIRDQVVQAIEREREKAVREHSLM
jgi:hypothetical protein